METYNKDSGSTPRPENISSDPGKVGRVLSGLFLIAIGVLLLARQAGVYFPAWIFSFETILIAVGLYIGIRHSFRGFGWMIPVAIGAFLLIDDVYPLYDFRHYTWPLVLIGLGLFIMLRSGRPRNHWRRWENRHALEENSASDYLDSTVVFGGAKRNIISKNFRGGDVVTVFGGTEINLMQAELAGTVTLELTQVFGGTKLIVPPHWRIWSKDMVAILGGIDDKRPMMSNQAAEEPAKTLVLKGTCMLGGIEIRSY